MAVVRAVGMVGKHCPGESYPKEVLVPFGEANRALLSPIFCFMGWILSALLCLVPGMSQQGGWRWKRKSRKTVPSLGCNRANLQTGQLQGHKVAMVVI